MPDIVRSSWPRLDTFRIAMTELQTPLSNTLVARVNATDGEQFFNIMEVQGEAVIQPYGVVDNAYWVSLTSIAIICVFHLVIMSILGL